jgi:hypothetical protein
MVKKQFKTYLLIEYTNLLLHVGDDMIRSKILHEIFYLIREVGNKLKN